MSKTAYVAIRNTVVGCLAGLLLCSSAAVMPAGAVTVTSGSDYGVSTKPDVDAGAEKEIVNVAYIASYSDIPDSVMDANLRNCLQLLDLTFAQSGLTENDAVTGSSTAFTVTREGVFAGFDIFDVKVVYDSVESGNEKPVKLYIGTADVALKGDGSEETQEVIDALAEGFGIENIEGTTEPFTGTNCTVLLRGAELVFAVTNTDGMIEIEITRSSAHSDEPGNVDKSLLESLIIEAWGYSSSDYTAATHAAVRSQISAGGTAATVYDNPEATAIEVINACFQLSSAIDGLEEEGVFPFKPKDFTKLMNTALTKVNDRVGTKYMALPVTTDDGMQACVVYDGSFTAVFGIMFMDRYADAIYDESVSVGGIAGFVMDGGDDTDFAYCSVAFVMAVDDSIYSLSTATDVCESILNAGVYNQTHSRNGAEWLFFFEGGTATMLASVL